MIWLIYDRMNCLTRLARSQRRPLAEGCQAGCNPGSVMLTSQERFTLWAFPHWRLACGATVHPSNGVTVSRSMLACCACGSQLANRSLCDRFLYLYLHHPSQPATAPRRDECRKVVLASRTSKLRALLLEMTGPPNRPQPMLPFHLFGDVISICLATSYTSI